MRVWIFVASVAILGTPVMGQQWFGALKLLPSTHQTALVADVDGDGDPDLVRRSAQTGDMVIAVNDGSGGPVEGSPQALPPGARPPLAQGDFNGDGTLDLVIATAVTGGSYSVVMLPGLGGGAFGMASPTSVSGLVQGFGVADVNGDGRDDLAVAHDEGFNLRVRNGVGNSTGLMSIGTAESAIPNLPSPGLTVLNFPWLGFVPLGLSGSSGPASAGSFDLPFVVPPSFAGQDYSLQIALLDGTAPAGITYSNGLELRFGF